MNGNLQDIMNSTSGRVTEQQLMDYLEGKLPPEQAHEVEKMMADSGFLDDAVEGLSHMKDKQRIATILHELNSKLHAKTRKQKSKHAHLLPDQQTLSIVALLTVLLLAVLAYVIFRMYQSR